jgi:hypothetical protein
VLQTFKLLGECTCKRRGVVQACTSALEVHRGLARILDGHMGRAAGLELPQALRSHLALARLSIAPHRGFTEPPPLDIAEPLSALSRELTAIRENTEYAGALRSLKYRRLAHPISKQEQPPKFPDIEAVTALAAIDELIGRISLVYNYGAEFGQKTISKTVESASTAASKMIVITLLTIAIGSATSIGPIASKVPEMTWLRTASEIVKKQLEKMLAEK